MSATVHLLARSTYAAVSQQSCKHNNHTTHNNKKAGRCAISKRAHNQILGFDQYAHTTAALA